MSITKVTPPELMTDQVYDAIRSAIMSGEMQAGSRLRIRDLAEQVGTSVMPVREAIRRLEQAGLAVRVPNKGAVVTQLDEADLADVYDVRRVLETEAARRGAREITEVEVGAMQQEYDRMQRAVAKGDLGAALDADEAMLEILYRAAGNPVLLDSIRSLWQRCRAYKLTGVQRAKPGDQSAWTGYQPRLVEAARAHDGVAAGRLTEQSLREASRRISASLRPASGTGRAVRPDAKPPVSRHRA